MTITDPATTPPRPGALARLRRHLPAPLLLVALVAAGLHIFPFLRSQWQTPPGWEFTGNLTGSPDEMQYRMLMQRAQEIGPIVDNRMTNEPNAPHIPMYFYYGLGKLAGWLDARPGYVYAYLGCGFAFLLALLLFWIVDHFAASRYQTWWIYLLLLFGGGLGAHLLLADSYWRFRAIFPFHRIVTEGLQLANPFEVYRNHYIFSTLFDTHFLFFLLVAILAILALYRAVTSFTVLRLLGAVLMFALVTVLHIYDGITLLSIAAGVVAVLWLRKLPTRSALITLVLCGLAVGAMLRWQMGLYRQAGLPIPPWRAPSILFSELALAYAVEWGIIAWGLVAFARTAGTKESFLLGWAAGCTLLTLSGPFYPYSDRGALTLQIPLMILAGSIYFARFPRVRPGHLIAALVLFGATPIWKVRQLTINTSFAHHPSGGPPPYTWMSPDHQELSAALRARATSQDALVVDKSGLAWRADDLWLTIGYPGTLYAGHYALTPNFDRKRDSVNAFYRDDDPATQAEFLRKARVRFVYVRAAQDPTRFSRVPSLVVLDSTSVGELFEFRPDTTAR